MSEAAALGGYQISGTSDAATNKTRALRRLNYIKADVISRYSGKWNQNYREGWLSLHPLAPCLATFTFNSFTVPVVSDGSSLGNTVFASGVPSYMVGAKILAADGSYYRIAATDANNVYLDQPFQGTTVASNASIIWNDEYPLYPSVLAVGGFVNYSMVRTMNESWPARFKESYPKPAATDNPSVYDVVGRQSLTAIYSTGTVSGTVNTNVLTGSGTSWKSNLQPGYEITIGSTKYHVFTVDSDTQVTLYQMLSQTIGAGTTYTAIGKNSPIVRFNTPANQILVHYWYWAKDYPVVNDSDEDWIMQMYPRVLINGIAYFDYIDKNDVARAFNSQQVYEDSIKNMRVAHDGGYTGVRTIPLWIPHEARE